MNILMQIWYKLGSEMSMISKYLTFSFYNSKKGIHTIFKNGFGIVEIPSFLLVQRIAITSCLKIQVFETED